MYIDQFADYLRLERNYSPKTVASYHRDLVLFQGFLKATDPDLDLLTADRDVVRLWVVDMMDKGEKSTTVNRKLTRTGCQGAQEQETAPAVCQGVRYGRTA